MATSANGSRPAYPTLLKQLLVTRRWRTYATFRREYERAAVSLDPMLAGSSPGREQFERWLAGRVRTLPYPDHCRVLEAMFPNFSAEQMFASPQTDQLLQAERPEARRPCPGRTLDAPGTVEVPPWEDEVADQSVEFVRRARVTAMDPVVLEQLEEGIRRIAWEYLHAPRQREHFTELVGVRDRAFRLIEDERHHPDQGRHLYALAGISCVLLAQASHELGFRRAGMSHAQAAFVCAELADHHSLRVWTRATQAAIAEYSGLPRETVRYAESGRSYASHGTAMVRLMSLAANGYARLGKLAEAEAALLAAREAREAVAENDPLDDVGGIFSVSLAKQHAYAASAYALLGDGTAAGREASQALELYQQEPTGQRQPVNEGYAHTDVAFARLLGGDLDGVGDALAPVFDLPARTRVDLFADKLRRLHGQLAAPAYQGSSTAEDLQERIEGFVATVGAESLP